MIPLFVIFSIAMQFNMPTGPGRSGDGDHGPSSAPACALPAAGDRQTFFHVDIRRSLQYHGRLARAIATSGAVLAVGYFLSQAFLLNTWPTYVAESIVHVQPKPSNHMKPSQGDALRWPFDDNTYESYVQQQMMNVRRDDVLAGALHKLQGFQRPGESDQVAAQRLTRRLQVTREPSAYQFSIVARSDDAEMAAQIANAVTASYIASATPDEWTGDSQRLPMLREERDRIQNVLLSDRTEQEALTEQLGAAPASASIPDQDDEAIMQIRAALVKARTEHDAAAARFASLGATHGPLPAAIDAEADGMIASDAGLASLKTALTTRRAVLALQMASLTPANPQYAQDVAELARINSTLDAMMKDLRVKAAAQIQTDLRADLQRSGELEAQLNEQLRKSVSAAGGATPKQQRSSDLVADISRLQARFSTVDELLHNLMLEESAPVAAFQVTPAAGTLTRSGAAVLRNAILIVIAGLSLGLLAAVIIEKLDPTVYIGSDVEQVLGRPPMAQLPDFTEVSGRAAEEYLLRLASAIECGCKQGNIKNCIFTGTGPGVGVSTLVNRVGTMLQAMGRPTVLVNATGAEASASPAGSGQRERAPGLVQLQSVSRPATLLQQMAAERETEQESLVLTDTAPLAVSPETEYLSRFVDCAVVVIESGMTTRADLREAAATLRRLDVGAVGFVLNRVGLSNADAAFRLSVAAVERHVQAQGNSTVVRTETSLSFTQARFEDREAIPKVEPAPKHLEPEVTIAAVARFSSQAVPTPSVAPGSEAARQLSPTAAVEPGGPLSPPASLAPATPRALDPHQVLLPLQPAANSGTEAPWRPSDKLRNTEPPRPPLLWHPAKAGTPRGPSSDGEPLPITQELNPETRQIWAAAAHSWERVPILNELPRAEAALEGLQKFGLEKAPAPLASRLSGLRNLFFVLGVKKAHSGEEEADQHADAESILDPWQDAGTQVATLERTISQAARNAAAAGSDGASPAQLTLPAEFYPPKPVVIEFDEPDDPAGESSMRQDRRAPFDGVDILPSRHGQYKKK